MSAVFGIMECGMCKIKLTSGGHNANPLLQSGMVCDECNTKLVLPLRRMLERRQEHRKDLRKQ